MEMTTDTKVILGVLIATVVIILGGALFASTRQPSPAQPSTVPAAHLDRLVPGTAAAIGAQHPKVTVVEFGDFQCPACGSLHPIMKYVQEQYQDQPVRFVWRHFPLAQHQHAQLAAEASVAAGEQGKFWEYHDLLFDDQTRLERSSLEQYAEQLGLDMEKFRAALDQHQHQEIVEADKSDGRLIGVSATPTIFINGAQYAGQYSAAAFQEVIDAELAK
jgi:protein-disulfide isomerase